MRGTITIKTRHSQNMAKSVPETILILDHFGTPIGVGPYANQKKEIISQLKQDLREMAKCENVVA